MLQLRQRKIAIEQHRLMSEGVRRPDATFKDFKTLLQFRTRLITAGLIPNEAFMKGVPPKVAEKIGQFYKGMKWALGEEEDEEPSFQEEEQMDAGQNREEEIGIDEENDEQPSINEDDEEAEMTTTSALTDEEEESENEEEEFENSISQHEGEEEKERRESTQMDEEEATKQREPTQMNEEEAMEQRDEENEDLWNIEIADDEDGTLIQMGIEWIEE